MFGMIVQFAIENLLRILRVQFRILAQKFWTDGRIFRLSETSGSYRNRCKKYEDILARRTASDFHRFLKLSRRNQSVRLDLGSYLVLDTSDFVEL
jgi:hypothetical protein